MDNVTKGMGAGLIASVIVAVLLWAKMAAGLAPGVDLVPYINMAFARLGVHTTPETGWIAYFIAGTFVLGGLFGAFNHAMPGRSELDKGILFSTIVWLVTMLAVMPVAGAGLFAVSATWGVPVVSLAFSLIYGLALGALYAAFIHVRPTQPLMIVPAD